MTLGSQQYANLADHSYGRDQNGNSVDLKSLVGKTTTIEGVQYKVLAHADKPSGYQGTIYQRVDSGEIVVAHRGTEFGREPIKDGVLADGGMVFARTNAQARDAIELTRDALGMARQQAADGHRARAPEVTVTGHSLGGTLAQITAHHFDLRGETFNPYGAASLNYRVPEGGDRVLNHVMAADVVSSASPHYGQVRVYAKSGEITQLKASGYSNSFAADLLMADNPIAASVNTSHMMHNFLNVDGDGKRDVSALGDAGMRTRADENARMIQDYRGDVRALRTGASLGGDAVDILKYGPLLAPGRAAERAREALLPDLPPGEPARREAQGRRTSAPLSIGGDSGRNTDHVVPAFQHAHDLEPVDGKAGKDTRVALIEAAKHPLVSEAAHPQHGLYAAIAAGLPEGTDPKVVANVAMQALENGIAQPTRVGVLGSDVWVMGTMPGHRIKVDMNAQVPDLQTISDHMREQSRQPGTVQAMAI